MKGKISFEMKSGRELTPEDYVVYKTDGEFGGLWGAGEVEIAPLGRLGFIPKPDNLYWRVIDNFMDGAKAYRVKLFNTKPVLKEGR